MEDKFDLAWEGNGCVFTIKGRVDKADMRRLALRQTGIEQGAHPTYMIVDLLEAEFEAELEAERESQKVA